MPHPPPTGVYEDSKALRIPIWTRGTRVENPNPKSSAPGKGSVDAPSTPRGGAGPL